MQRIVVHPLNPQARLLARAVEALREGALIVYPTDSGYALGWQLDAQAAQQRVERLRALKPKHNYTLMCADLKQASTLAQIDDRAFRFIRQRVPGPYTFVVPARASLPKRLANPKKRSVGVRIPDHKIALALIAELGEPMLTSTLLIPGEDLLTLDVDDLAEALEGRVDVFLDAGYCGSESTTVVDLLGAEPALLRAGAGAVDWE